MHQQEIKNSDDMSPVIDCVDNQCFDQLAQQVKIKDFLSLVIVC